MPCQNKEPDIAHLALVLWFAPKHVFLYVRDTFHEKANREEYHSSDVSSSTEFWLIELRYIRRIQDGHGQRDRPDPQHLKDPESKEGKELVSLIVEAVVFASFENAKEEETRESCAP